MNRKNETVRSVVLGTVRRQPLLCTALVLAVAGAVAASLLPPLVLGRVVDRLTARQAVPLRWRWGTLDCWHFPAGWIPCGKVC